VRLQAIEGEVAQLKQELQQARSRHAQASELQEANERLVVSAMEAETAADSAFSQLEDLSRSAHVDPLTDTPNRLLMRDRIETAIGLARRHEGRLAVIFVDLDNFKAINDKLGYAVGDLALSVAARRLESVVRESDTVSRHGGDEYLLLLSELSHPNDAGVIAEKVLSALDQPMEQHAFRLGASLGIAVYPRDGIDAASLIDNADAAMYIAKRAGGGRFEFFGGNEAAGLVTQDRSEGRSGDWDRIGAHEGLRDMGRLREANQRLVIAALAAQEAESVGVEVQQRHETFVSMVAHELRAPLMPLRTCSELLLSSDSATLGRLQGIIKRQIDHLVRIVDDLLEGSRVNGGKFRLDRRHVDLLPLIDASIDSCRAAMVNRGQTLVEQRPVPGGVLLVDGDAARLVQIFGNLLDNASKYTPAGGTIWLTVAREAETMVVTITDTGLGIERDVLPRIFDLFVQDPRVIEVHSGGLGIGLAVVKDLVQGHDGTVSATSGGRGQGSSFRVTLPVVEEHRS
jgi:diguanylate cyclase (GGDEF)-like protein